MIADPLFLAHYIEKAGTGCLDMIRLCRECGLPEPDFEQRGNQFVVTLWRDWLTDDVLSGFGLNERQMKAVTTVKITGKITNKGYRQVTGASRASAIRDLAELVAKGIFVRRGKARGAYYVITERRLNIDSNDSTHAPRK